MQTQQAPVRLPPNFALIVVASLGLLMAVLLGTLIGSNDPLPFLFVLGAGAVLLFVLKLNRYVWQTSLLLSFLAFGYRPFGFSFGALELSCALALALVLSVFWQNRSLERPKILQTQAFSMMQFALLLWLIYVGVHMFANITNPFRPGDFVLSNAIKSYVFVSGPLAVLFYFSLFPNGIFVPGGFFRTILRLCLIGLVVNLCTLSVQLIFGTTLYIPVVNLIANGNALRTLGPLAMLLGTVALTGPDRRKNSSFAWLACWFLIVGGTAGAILSGGRSEVVFGFGIICAILFFRRRFGLLAAVGSVGILTLFILQFAAPWINTKASPNIQRSLQWVLVEKGSKPLESIESSTDWRIELARRALNEWRSEARLFWFGRATFGYGTADEVAMDVSGGWEATLETSLRRGATHNLTTDLLVAYGLVGCVLYFFVYFSIVRFLWVTRTRGGLSVGGRDLVLACLVLAIFNFFFQLVGAGGYVAEIPWLIIVLIGSFYSGVGQNPVESPGSGRASASGSSKVLEGERSTRAAATSGR